MGPAMANSYMNGMYDFTPVRRQLNERRSMPPLSSQRQSSLPPVPELPTPTMIDESPMTQSRLFQEFSNKQRVYAVPLRQRQLSAPTTYPIPYDTSTTLYSNGQIPMTMPAPIPTALPASMATIVHQGSPRPHSTMMAQQLPPAVPQRPMSMPPNGSGFQDTQAILTVAFHPTGRYFAIGTNSNHCTYVDIPTSEN